MDTDTRLDALDARLKKLEDLADETLQRVNAAMSKLETHPILGGIVRMFKE